MSAERSASPHKCPKCQHRAPFVVVIRVIGDPIFAIDYHCSACDSSFTQVCELLYTKVFSAKPEE